MKVVSSVSTSDLLLACPQLVGKQPPGLREGGRYMGCCIHFPILCSVKSF